MIVLPKSPFCWCIAQRSLRTPWVVFSGLFLSLKVIRKHGFQGDQIGHFLPIGKWFYFEHFINCINEPKFWATFCHGGKMVWSTIWAVYFTNSSGHPCGFSVIYFRSETILGTLLIKVFGFSLPASSWFTLPCFISLC
jgi:hypothetical protein